MKALAAVGLLLAAAWPLATGPYADALYFLPLRFYLATIPMASLLLVLAPRTRPITLPVLAWLWGYLAVELWFRAARVTVPTHDHPALVNLNDYFLHRFHQVLAVAVIALLLRHHAEHVRFGDLSTLTGILGKERTWRSVVLRFIAWLGLALAVIAVLTPRQPGDPLVVALPILLGAVLNSTIEEIIFRGYLLSTFRTVLADPRANLLQALLFGLIHYPSFDPVHYAFKVVVFTFLGWLFGRATLETRGLAASCLMHSAIVLAVELRVRL